MRLPRLADDGSNWREPDVELREEARRQRQDERARLQPGSQQSGFDANRYKRSSSACRPDNWNNAKHRYAFLACFWLSATDFRRHNRRSLGLQGDDPPLVSPLETDIQAVNPKLGCEPAQLIAELFAVLWPIGRCGDLLADDCRELGVQLGGCLGQPVDPSRSISLPVAKNQRRNRLSRALSTERLCRASPSFRHTQKSRPRDAYPFCPMN
jgi:hypothetical protein